MGLWSALIPLWLAQLATARVGVPFDHLQPEIPVSLSPYEFLVNRALFGHHASPVFGMRTGEKGMAVIQEPNDGGLQFFAVAMKIQVPIWLQMTKSFPRPDGAIPGEELAVLSNIDTRIEISRRQLSSLLACHLDGLWRTALQDVHSAKDELIRADGTTYHFFGNSAGWAWSPRSGTRMAQLVKLAMSLGAYADGRDSASSVTDLESQIRKTADVFEVNVESFQEEHLLSSACWSLKHSLLSQPLDR